MPGSRAVCLCQSGIRLAGEHHVEGGWQLSAGAPGCAPAVAAAMPRREGTNAGSSAMGLGDKGIEAHAIDQAARQGTERPTWGSLILPSTCRVFWHGIKSTGNCRFGNTQGHFLTVGYCVSRFKVRLRGFPLGFQVQAISLLKFHRLSIRWSFFLHKHRANGVDRGPKLVVSHYRTFLSCISHVHVTSRRVPVAESNARPASVECY